MTDFDVVVAGAGPAGAWMSYRLATAGARVAVVDGSHPREKPCGGGISARALQRLKSLPVERLAHCVRITTAAFRAGSETASVSLPSTDGNNPALVVMSRRDFDGTLLAAACEAGAEHIPQRVTAVTRVGTGWTIGAGDRTVRCSWVVGADGANSFVRRRVYQSFRRDDLSVASGYFVRDRSGSRIDIDFMTAPAGYLWSFPRPDHLAVGMCGQAHDASSHQLFAAVRNWIDTRLNGIADRSLRRYSWPIPSLSERALIGDCPAGDRWLLVGDAAGLVDPITREGIYFALESADLAAGALAGSDATTAYLTAVRASIHQELRKAARMKARFFALGFTRLLVRALRGSQPVRRIMAGLISGEQGYTGLRRRLLMTGEWRLALKYLQLPATSPSIHRVP